VRSCGEAGSQTFVNFSGDDSIARGFDFECTGGIVPIEKGGPARAYLCQIRGEGQGSDYGLICMDNEVVIQTVCDDNQHGDWFNNSFVVLANLGDSDWGFRVNTVNGSLPSPYGEFSDGTKIYLQFPVPGTFGSYFIDSSNDYSFSADLIWGVVKRGSYYLGWAN